MSRVSHCAIWGFIAFRILIVLCSDHCIVSSYVIRLLSNDMHQQPRKAHDWKRCIFTICLGAVYIYHHFHKCTKGMLLLRYALPPSPKCTPKNVDFKVKKYYSQKTITNNKIGSLMNMHDLSTLFTLLSLIPSLHIAKLSGSWSRSRSG